MVAKSISFLSKYIDKYNISLFALPTITDDWVERVVKGMSHVPKIIKIIYMTEISSKHVRSINQKRYITNPPH